MRLYRPTWKTPDGERHRSPRWWLDFYHADGRRCRLPGLTDKRQTEALAARVERLLAIRISGDALPGDLLQWLEQVPKDFRKRLVEADLLDSDRAGGVAPLMILDAQGKVTGGHLASFLLDLTARNVSVGQIDLVRQRCRDILLKAGARWIRDLSTARIQEAISSFASPSPNRSAGLSKQSLHHYVRAIKQFSRWLRRERRTAEDSLYGLKSYNAEVDRPYVRRGFTADEMMALLDYTTTAPTRWGMTGPARGASYHLAYASGLRRNEIRTLTTRSFNFWSDPVTVTVEAGYSKHRRQDVQPLPREAAEAMKEYLATADPERPFRLPAHTARMLRADMAGAREAMEDPGEDFLQPRDSRGLVLDFHSFRHGYITGICRAPVSPRVMMEFARHTTPRLTMKLYSRVSVADSTKALEFLPKLTRQSDNTAATGTDDAGPPQDGRSAPGSNDRAQGDHLPHLRNRRKTASQGAHKAMVPRFAEIVPAVSLEPTGIARQYWRKPLSALCRALCRAVQSRVDFGGLPRTQGPKRRHRASPYKHWVNSLFAGVRWKVVGCPSGRRSRS